MLQQSTKRRRLKCAFSVAVRDGAVVVADVGDGCDVLVVWPGQLRHRVGDAMGSDRRSTKQWSKLPCHAEPGVQGPVR
jgi:hypothetical protein